MKELEIIISLVGVSFTFLVSATTFLMKFIKNAKAKRIAENIIKIGNAVAPFVVKAETFINYSGEEKKNYVMTEAAKFAISKGIPFDEKLVSEKIEELVALTKSVNKREKDIKKESEI